MKNNQNIIGQRINTLLATNNKKQKDLAEYLNVTDNTISYFCSGTRVPNTEQVIKIADFFNVSTDYLLGRTNFPTIDIKIKDLFEIANLHEKITEVKTLADEMTTVISKIKLEVEL